MRLGVHCSNLSWQGGAEALGPTLARVAQVADEGGAHTVTLMDHYFQMEMLGGPPEPMVEGYTGLGFLAGQTSRVELGLLVSGVTYRHPGLLAKIVTTLDVLSGGRAMLGLGAAWYEREHRGLGVPYPRLAERFERLEETLQICKQAWNGGGRFEGEHYQLEELTLVPQPLQQGGPRIVIGGGGEQKTLKLVAQYGDATNLFHGDDVERKLEVLRRHCDDAGRDYASVSKTFTASRSRPLVDPDAWLADVQRYADLGFDQVWIGPEPEDPVGSIERFCAEILPRLSEM